MGVEIGLSSYLKANLCNSHFLKNIQTEERLPIEIGISLNFSLQFSSQVMCQRIHRVKCALKWLYQCAISENPLCKIESMGGGDKVI